MANFTGFKFTATAGAAASSGTFAKMNSNGKVTKANSAGERCVGVFITSPTGDGELCDIQYRGIVYVKSGYTSAINAGVEISTKTNAEAAPGTAGHYIMGIAMGSAAASGDYFPIVLTNYQKNA